MGVVHMVVTNPCAPDPRVERHAAWLAEAGWEVTVHAFDRTMSHPETERRGKVLIRRHRVGAVPYGRPLRSSLGIRRFRKAVAQAIAREGGDVVYCHDADTLPVGLKVARRTQASVVFDMHDLHHTWLLMNAPSSLWRRALSGALKRRMLRQARKCDAVITSSGRLGKGGHGGLQDWLHAHGVQAVNVMNGSTSSGLPHKNEGRASGTWTVGYVGRVRDRQAFEHLVSALKSMPDDERPKLHIAGDGVAVPFVQRLLEANPDVKATLTGAFAGHELPALVGTIDVMYAMYDPSRGNLTEGALPVKVFDAARHGVPSVVNSGCLAADLVDRNGWGHHVAWGDVDRIASALMALRNTVVEDNDHLGDGRQRLVDAVQRLA